MGRDKKISSFIDDVIMQAESKVNVLRRQEANSKINI